MKSLFHITCVTHNSRESERMRRLKIKKGRPVVLSDKEEIEFTKIFASVVKRYKIKITEYNICADHIHFIIYCNKEELETVVGKIKSTSAVNFGKEQRPGISKLWAQKFNRKEIDTEEQLNNTALYIRQNRLKHGLERNPELEAIIASMLVSYEDLFAGEEVPQQSLSH